MATICEFGTAPVQALEGYRIHGIITGKDADVLASYEGREVRLVRGPAIFGQEGCYEFAVMSTSDCLWFSDRSDAERFMNAVIASGNEASLTVDPEAHEFDDPDVFGVTYTGAEVTEFSATPYSAIGRRASRFNCHG